MSIFKLTKLKNAKSFGSPSDKKPKHPASFYDRGCKLTVGKEIFKNSRKIWILNLIENESQNFLKFQGTYVTLIVFANNSAGLKL